MQEAFGLIVPNPALKGPGVVAGGGPLEVADDIANGHVALVDVRPRVEDDLSASRGTVDLVTPSRVVGDIGCAWGHQVEEDVPYAIEGVPVVDVLVDSRRRTSPIRGIDVTEDLNASSLTLSDDRRVVRVSGSRPSSRISDHPVNPRRPDRNEIVPVVNTETRCRVKVGRDDQLLAKTRDTSRY